MEAEAWLHRNGNHSVARAKRAENKGLISIGFLSTLCVGKDRERRTAASTQRREQDHLKEDEVDVVREDNCIGDLVMALYELDEVLSH